MSAEFFRVYSRRQLYEVVSDVTTYPQFVPFCTGSHILRPLMPEPDSKQLSMDAELTVGFMSFKESYVSKVTCLPYESVEAVASSGTHLFKTLTTTWKFQPVSSHPSTKTHGEEYGRTLVILDLAYAFTNPLHASISAAFFGQVSKLMIQAFENRYLRSDTIHNLRVQAVLLHIWDMFWNLGYTGHALDIDGHHSGGWSKLEA